MLSRKFNFNLLRVKEDQINIQQHTFKSSFEKMDDKLPQHHPEVFGASDCLLVWEIPPHSDDKATYTMRIAYK